MINLKDIQKAGERISGYIHKTPLQSSRLIGEIAGVELYLKCENLQKTGSFKVRGALNKVLREDLGNMSRGVVTVSAGNHAQSLAYAASMVSVGCTVVMPKTAVVSKINACINYGANVVLEGTVFDAFDKSLELAESEDLTFVHPFDDKNIIAGQGTIGLEIAEQVEINDIDIIIVQIGGGGLISGVASCLKQLNPKLKIFGVEPEGANTMRLSFDSGRPEKIEKVTTIADGLGAPMAGDLTYPITKKYVEDIIIVNDNEIKRAMGLILSRAKLMCEPAGAASVAALLAGKIPVKKEQKVICILSGGNIDLKLFGEIISENSS